MKLASLLLLLAFAGLPATPAAAAPAKPRALKPGLARCQVNGGPVQPCTVRSVKPGSFDVETRGDPPYLAYVDKDGVYFFQLFGPQKTQVSLYGTYAADPADPACWQSDDPDVVVRSLCVR